MQRKQRRDTLNGVEPSGSDAYHDKIRSSQPQHAKVRGPPAEGDVVREQRTNGSPGLENRVVNTTLPNRRHRSQLLYGALNGRRVGVTMGQTVCDGLDLHFTRDKELEGGQLKQIQAA